MHELGPARAWITLRLGSGNYVRGEAILNEKLEAARAFHTKAQWRKAGAGVIVVLASLLLLGAGIVFAGSRQPFVAAPALILALPILYLAVAQFAAFDGYARFGRAPRVLANLLPGFVDRWFAARITLDAIDAGDLFDDLKSRRLVAKAGGHELAPLLFGDGLWPFLFSSDSAELARAAWREYGYDGGAITIFEVVADYLPGVVETPAASALHPFQQISVSLKDAWIAEAARRKSYPVESHQHALLIAVLDALWEELHSEHWQGRKLNNAEIARRCHKRVVAGDLGFQSTELTEGRTSTEPGDWIQKVIAGRAKGYGFAHEAAEVLIAGKTREK